MRKTDESLREEGELGLACWSGQSRGMAVAHRHRDLEINYVLSGSMIYLVGGRVVELPPRRVCLLWGGVPHQMIRPPSVIEAIWVTIPLTTVLRWGLPDHLIRPLLAFGFVADSDPRPGDLDLLHQWLTDLKSVNDATRQIVLLEIEARLRRFALGLPSPLPTDPRVSEIASDSRSDRGLAAIETMAQFITQNFREEIGIAEIAEAAHLHPNYAMTLFRRHTGMTLSQYLVLQRVAHAQRLLATTEDTITEIALDSGFGSVSRFYEAFRQQTGDSPGRFRLRRESALP